jgi:hypothetical protein
MRAVTPATSFADRILPPIPHLPPGLGFSM